MNSSFPTHMFQNITIQWDDKALTLKPSNKSHKYCLIFLQGHIMTVSHFLSVFLSPPLLELLSDFKIVFPIPPKRLWKMKNSGQIRNVFSWYDYLDKSSVMEAKENIEMLVKKELEEVNNDMSRMFLGAFSQGSTIMLWIINDMKEKVGGVLIVSGFYLNIHQVVIKDDLPPIVFIHGLKDEIVPWNDPEWSFGKILENKSVKTVIFDDMKHDIAHKEAQETMYSFIRSITGKTVKPRL